MSDEKPKDQEKQEELTEKDLDQASGGAPRTQHENPARNHQTLRDGQTK